MGDAGAHFDSMVSRHAAQVLTRRRHFAPTMVSAKRRIGRAILDAVALANRSSTEHSGLRRSAHELFQGAVELSWAPVYPDSDSKQLRRARRVPGRSR